MAGGSAPDPPEPPDPDPHGELQGGWACVIFVTSPPEVGGVNEGRVARGGGIELRHEGVVVAVVGRLVGSRVRLYREGKGVCDSRDIGAGRAIHGDAPAKGIIEASEVGGVNE